MTPTVSTEDLHQRHGLSSNAVHRLIGKGVIRGDNPGTGMGGYRFDEAEQRAVAAVVAFRRSHLMSEGGHNNDRLTRDRALRAIAETARTHDPGDASVRWIMLLPDGTCLRVSDELAASWPEARTLIEIDPFTDRSPQRNA